MLHAKPFALFLTLTLAGSGCASTTNRHAPTKAWSQPVVTDLAARLAGATEAAYSAVYASPELEMPGEERAGEGMAGSLRVMHESSVGLHAKLAEGKGMEATLNEYRHIKELSRDVREASGFTDLGASQATPLGGVTGVLDQLDAYYGAQ